MKFKCNNCNHITEFSEEGIDIEEFPDSDLVMILTDKEYICEKCGLKLELYDII